MLVGPEKTFLISFIIFRLVVRNFMACGYIYSYVYKNVIFDIEKLNRYQSSVVLCIWFCIINVRILFAMYLKQIKLGWKLYL